MIFSYSLGHPLRLQIVHLPRSIWGDSAHSPPYAIGRSSWVGVNRKSGRPRECPFTSAAFAGVAKKDASDVNDKFPPHLAPFADGSSSKLRIETL